MAGSHEVRGSNPLGSTINSQVRRLIRLACFRVWVKKTINDLLIDPFTALRLVVAQVVAGFSCNLRSYVLQREIALALPGIL
jgi:hypothetical protein